MIACETWGQPIRLIRDQTRFPRIVLRQNDSRLMTSLQIVPSVIESTPTCLRGSGFLLSLPFTAGLRFVTSISGWSSPWPVRCGMRPHPDGGTCAGGGPRCTGAHASVWSGKAGQPRYCKSKACIDLGKERGHIVERENTPGNAKSKRKVAEVDDCGDPCETEAWWPTRIDCISSIE